MHKNRDHALVERCLGGDREALRALIEEYQRPLFTAAFRILGNGEDAADATQSAFLKAFEHLDGYDPKYKFFSWIYRITVNEAINLSRRNARQTGLDENQPDGGDGPDKLADSDDLSQAIQAGLMGLTDEYRTVVVLRHFSDFSYREIGEILQIPEKTVKSRLYSARQLLKEHLVGAGVSI